MKFLLLLVVTATAVMADNSTTVAPKVIPHSTNKRVTIECLARDVKIKFTPLEMHKGKLAVEMNMNKTGCFQSGRVGEEVELVANFKQCTNKIRTFDVRIIEKYKGSKRDPDYKYKKGTRTSYTTITCPPFPRIPVDIHFRDCPGTIYRVNGRLGCYEDE